jgi:hypothetical protein
MSKTVRRFFSARNLIRFLWFPKIGDRVYVQENDKQIYHKASVKAVQTIADSENKSVQRILLNEFQGDYTSIKLLYRPSPQDYLKLLTAFPNWAYLQETEVPGYWIGGLKINRGRVILQGKPYKILTELLNLREVDIAINNAVNQMITTLQGDLPGGYVRIRKLEEKSSDTPGQALH